MGTIELRHVISEYLSQIDDISFLKAIKTIIESKATDQVYKLTPDQKKRVEMGREQFQNGKTIPQEELKIEIDQWLNSK
jgi:hypothetical protein